MWQEYTEKLQQNGLNDLDYCDGVITHLEPDILECEVKWALGSITTNKASGGDGIPDELFQILKDDAVKCCTQYASKLGKLSNGHRTGKGQFSFQSQRQCQIIFKLLHNCTHLTHQESNAQNSPCQASTVREPRTKMFKLDLEKSEEAEIKLPTSAGSQKKRVPEKHVFLLYRLCQRL